MHERARCSGGCARHAEASRRRVSRMKSSAKRTSQRAGANMASPPIAVTNKPSHRFSTSQLLTFSTSSLILLQRFNGSRHRRLNVKCRAQPAQSLLRVYSPRRVARGRRMESTGVERHRLQDPRARVSERGREQIKTFGVRSLGCDAVPPWRPVKITSR